MEELPVRGIDKTAGEILLGFLKFYSLDFAKSSENERLIINITPDAITFPTAHKHFNKLFDKDYCEDFSIWNDRQYIVRDPFNNSYNPAKVKNSGVNYQEKFKKAFS